MGVQQLVRDVTWGLAQRPPKPTGEAGWHFGPGVSLWVNPEVRCPWCDTGVPTGRVWALDEGRGKVLRVWTLAGVEIKDVRKWHPHVFETGRVCLGDADTVAGALWMGLQPGDRANTEIDIRAWLEGMGHPCTAWQVTYVSNDDAEEEDDHDGESYCGRCEEYYNEDDVRYCNTADRNYCDDCWAETHEQCADCDEWVLTDSSSRRREYMMEVAGGGRVCDSCYSNNYFTCDGCSDVYPDGDMNQGPSEDDNYCEGCYRDARAECVGCDVEGWKDDLDDDDLCGECAAKELVCGECDGRTDELLDGKCRACYYGDTVMVPDLPFEEVANGQ